MIVCVERSVRVTITLPLELREEVERARTNRRQSRSSYIAGSLRATLAAEAAAAKEEAWLAGYRRQPLTATEQELGAYGLEQVAAHEEPAADSR